MMEDKGPTSGLDKSPFAKTYAKLTANGYHALPIIPGAKVPGKFVSGLWRPHDGWNKHLTAQPPEFILRLWASWPEAGIGVILGSPVMAGWELGGIDFDTDDTMMLEMMEASLPVSPVRKRGKRGYTAFVLLPSGTKGRRFKRGPQTICEILTGTATRQTVLPPSIHPETGQPYVWMSRDTLETLAPMHLPKVSEDQLERFIDTVESFADVEEAKGATFVIDTEGSPHRDLNQTALKHLDAWVPALSLYRLKRTGAGYQAVPTWRPSGTGRPDHERKLNLGIAFSGIRDFGIDQGHSPLDICMLSQSWSLDDAFEWLSNRLGLLDEGFGEATAGTKLIDGVLVNADGVVVDLEAGMGPAAWDRVVEPEPLPEPMQPVAPKAAPKPADDELPNHLTRPGGLLGDLIDWIEGTARQPSRPMALGSALTVLGTLMGRKVAGPTHSGTHLYTVALAPSAVGKDHGLRMVGRLLRAANAEEMIGPGEFMSQSAVYRCLVDVECLACPMDEIGVFLRKITRERASSHEEGISGALRTLWGSSFEPVPVPRSAARETETIERPSLSIFGCSVPEEFFASLRSAEVLNGLLNRFLLIEHKRMVRDREPAMSKFDIPAHVENGLLAFKTRFDLGFSQGTIVEPKWMTMGWEDDAAVKVFEDAKDDIFTLRQDEGVSPFYARTVEMGVRLATIRAGSAGRPTVSAADMEWGYAVSRWSSDRMIAMAHEHMAENEFAGTVNRIVRIVKSLDEPGTRKDIQMRLRGSVTPKVLDDALKTAVESGRLVELSPEPKGVGVRGRAPTAKRYRFGH